MDENWGRPIPNLYVYLICEVFLGLLIIINIFHPDVTSNREDRVSKSTEDLIRTIPLSKDCCCFENNESFQLDCKVRNPKNYLSWIINLFKKLLNAFLSSNSNTLDRFRQISFQIYPISALQSLTLL